MSRKKTTVYIEEDLLRSAKVAAARSGWKEYEVFEEALKSYLGLDTLERVWGREGLPDATEAQELAYEELRAFREPCQSPTPESSCTGRSWIRAF